MKNKKLLSACLTLLLCLSTSQPLAGMKTALAFWGFVGLKKDGVGVGLISLDKEEEVFVCEELRNVVVGKKQRGVGFLADKTYDFHKKLLKSDIPVCCMEAFVHARDFYKLALPFLWDIRDGFETPRKLKGTNHKEFKEIGFYKKLFVKSYKRFRKLFPREERKNMHYSAIMERLRLFIKFLKDLEENFGKDRNLAQAIYEWCYNGHLDDDGHSCCSQGGSTKNGTEEKDCLFHCSPDCCWRGIVIIANTLQEITVFIALHKFFQKEPALHTVFVVIPRTQVQVEKDAPDMIATLLGCDGYEETCRYDRRHLVYDDFVHIEEKRGSETVFFKGLFSEGRPMWKAFCRNQIASFVKKILPICDYCKKPVISCNRCSRCLLVYYCDRACQRKDWKRHKACCFSHKEKTLKAMDKYECYNCFTQFYTFDDIVRHCEMRGHGRDYSKGSFLPKGKNLLRCEICSEKFGDEESWEKHRQKTKHESFSLKKGIFTEKNDPVPHKFFVGGISYSTEKPIDKKAKPLKKGGRQKKEGDSPRKGKKKSCGEGDRS